MRKECAGLRGLNYLYTYNHTYRLQTDSYLEFNILQYEGSVSELGLLQTSLRYVPRHECERLHSIRLAEDMFCLYGDAARDTCKGDSGGGVVWNGWAIYNTKFVDFGIYYALCRLHFISILSPFYILLDTAPFGVRGVRPSQSRWWDASISCTFELCWTLRHAGFLMLFFFTVKHWCLVSLISFQCIISHLNKYTYLIYN